MITKSFQQGLCFSAAAMLSGISVAAIFSGRSTDATLAAVLAFEFSNAYRIGELETERQTWKTFQIIHFLRRPNEPTS